jgi:peptidoglycan/xylan/chitin deacetylase (PgdA/CDA1 family)
MVRFRLQTKFFGRFLGSFIVLLSLCSYGIADGLVIEHGRRDSREIAITFDACPTTLPDEYDEKVIEVLLRKKTPATLFLSGRWVEKNPEKVKFLSSQPQFEIANHAFWHPHLLEKDDERILRELKRTQAIIKKVTDRSPRFFRPPYGEVDERVAAIAQKAGLATIQYDIASGDPDAGLSPQRIIRSILRDAKGGSIIVLHMNRKGVHTAEVLPDIIDGLQKRGFTLVTVGELLSK